MKIYHGRLECFVREMNRKLKNQFQNCMKSNREYGDKYGFLVNGRRGSTKGRLDKKVSCKWDIFRADEAR